MATIRSDPASAGEIAEAAEWIVALPSLEVRGLMTVAPFGSNAEQIAGSISATTRASGPST